MKKTLALLAILIFSVVGLALGIRAAYAWTQRAPLPISECRVHSPWGFADSQQTLRPICRQGYLSAYDERAKIPAYVAYTLTPANALGCVARTDAFVADASVPNGPRPDDYANTGFDKGHAAPDGDLSWDQQVEYESFLMTNMFPQHGSLNRGIWKLLETSIRGWAVQQNTTYTIYTGAIYGNDNPRIGRGVIVPHAFYKIVVNHRDGTFAGWQFPHTAPYQNLGNDLTRFRVPVVQIQRAAGISFEFPANPREINPGQEWPVDFGELTNAKRAKCRA